MTNSADGGLCLPSRGLGKAGTSTTVDSHSLAKICKGNPVITDGTIGTCSCMAENGVGLLKEERRRTATPAQPSIEVSDCYKFAALHHEQSVSEPNLCI